MFKPSLCRYSTRLQIALEVKTEEPDETSTRQRVRDNFSHMTAINIYLPLCVNILCLYMLKFRNVMLRKISADRFCNVVLGRLI